MGLCRRLAHELLHNAVTSWQAIMPHPHIVTLRSVINSRDFDDLNDLICARTPPLVNSNPTTGRNMLIRGLMLLMTQSLKRTGAGVPSII